MISQDMSSPLEAPVCRRCGMCCLRGGPTLMQADLPRLTGNVLTLETLVCLRAGEWARDDARGELRPLDRECIKVAGLGGQAHPWRCRFYRDASGCGIYAHRPVQCSALFCMNTDPLEDLLAREPLLDRAKVLETLAPLAHIPGFYGMPGGARALLPDLVAAHEEQNPVVPVLEAAARLGFAPRGARDHAGESAGVEEGERQNLIDGINKAVCTEAAFRELCVERAGVPAAMLPFLLGRSMADLLVEVGLRPAAQAQ